MTVTNKPFEDTCVGCVYLGADEKESYFHCNNPDRNHFMHIISIHHPRCNGYDEGSNDYGGDNEDNTQNVDGHLLVEVDSDA